MCDKHILTFLSYGLLLHLQVVHVYMCTYALHVLLFSPNKNSDCTKLDTTKTQNIIHTTHRVSSIFVVDDCP
jgi:hypothetical protein